MVFTDVAADPTADNAAPSVPSGLTVPEPQPAPSLPGQWLAWGALVLALGGISSASIFTVMAEAELPPVAVIWQRLTLATIAFALWGIGQHWRRSVAIASPSKAWKSALLPTVGTAALPLPTLGLFGLAGLSLAGSQLCSGWALTQTSVANTTLLNNLMPIFTTLGAWFVFGQRFQRKFLLGLGVALVGVGAIAVQDVQVAGDQLWGDSLALLAALLLAIALLSLEQLRSQFSTPTVMVGTGLVSSVCLLPLLLSVDRPLLPTSPEIWGAVLGLALISQVLGNGLLTYCLKQLPAGLVAVTMLGVPVLAASLALVLFAQTLTLASAIAFGIVLSGIYLAITAQTAPDARTAPDMVAPLDTAPNISARGKG